MGYRLEVRNTTNFGCKTFKLETLSDVKKVLNDYLFEGEVKLYEEKEIPFVIKYGKSKYSFVIDGKGYLELWKQMQKNNIEYDSKTSN